MDFQLLSNIARVELDAATGWVKATRVTGETFLIQPRDLLTLMTWGQGNTQALVASQQAIDQGQARPVRLVEALPLETASPPALSVRKRKRKRPLPLPIIQISEALPCLISCKSRTMTALLDFGYGPHDAWQLYPLCQEHLQVVLAQREATGLSLKVIIEHLRADA